MSPNQDTLQQASRQEGDKDRRTGLTVCLVLRSSLQLEGWSCESTSQRSEQCQEAKDCTRRPTCRRASRHVHLTHTHSHTHTPGWLGKNFDIPFSAVETSLAVTNLTDSCNCLVLCSRCGSTRCTLLHKVFPLKARGESDTVSVSFRVSARYVRSSMFV